MTLLADDQRPLMIAALDRLVPAVDDLPAAGAMGVLGDIERMVTPADRFGRALQRIAAALSTGTEAAFGDLGGTARDAVLLTLESRLPEDFAHLLEITYLAYYSRPEVHARIGWRTGPLQPLGFELPPFDEATLATARRRPPFWRRT